MFSRTNKNSRAVNVYSIISVKDAIIDSIREGEPWGKIRSAFC